MRKKEISNSIVELKENLSHTARVEEWARLMGYTCPKKFARKFLRYHSTRPQLILKFIRLKSISKQLRKNNMSNFEIARRHGMPDEIALNKFINYHLHCSPTDLKKMPKKKVRQRLRNTVLKNGSNSR